MACNRRRHSFRFDDDSAGHEQVPGKILRRENVVMDGRRLSW